jgi:hypothetical protein
MCVSIWRHIEKAKKKGFLVVCGVGRLLGLLNICCTYVPLIKGCGLAWLPCISCFGSGRPEDKGMKFKYLFRGVGSLFCWFYNPKVALEEIVNRLNKVEI